MPRSEILLVGDEPANVVALKWLLHDSYPTARVELVDGFAAALDYLLGRGAHSGRDTQDQPQLVLLEVREEADAWLDFVEALRRSEASWVRVVALAPPRSPALLSRCYQAGVNSAVCKPATAPAFKRALQLTCDFWLGANETLPVT